MRYFTRVSETFENEHLIVGRVQFDEDEANKMSRAEQSRAEHCLVLKNAISLKDVKLI